MVMVAAVFLQLVIFVSSAQAVVLYDGSLGGGNETPDDQGWWYITNPETGSSAMQSASGGVTTLDTTPSSGDTVQGISPALPSLLSLILTTH